MIAKPFVLIEETQAAIRIYPEGHPTSYCARWGQSMLLVRRQCEPGTADITLHSAPTPHTRATLRALRDALRAHGLHAVYSLRGDGHTILALSKSPQASGVLISTTRSITMIELLFTLIGAAGGGVFVAFKLRAAGETMFSAIGRAVAPKSGPRPTTPK